MTPIRLRLLLPLLALACGGEHASDARPPPDPDDRGGGPARVSDAAGRRVELARQPQRIVSLVPSATRTLVALGAGGRLVGRTDYDTFPPVEALPSVGGGLHPSLERLVSLEPDLVVRFRASSDRSTPERLDALEIPQIAVRPDGIDDVRSMIRTLGRTTGTSSAADSLVAAIDSALSRVARRVGERPPRTVAYVLGGEPLWVAGPGTYIDQLIRAAGGRNAFSDLDDLYGPVSREAFVARPIELVLTSEGTELAAGDVGGLPVRRVPRTVERPGPRLGESAWALARAIHPEAFP